MKKMLIAAVAVISVIASIVGCQVYDSQTNQVLASGMNRDGQEIFKLQDFMEKYNSSCAKFRDNSSDTESYDTIIDMYAGFDKFKKAISSTANAIIDNSSEATDDRNQHKHDPDYVLKIYKENYMTKDALYAFLYNGLLKEYANQKGEFKPNEKDSASAQAAAKAAYEAEQKKFALEYDEFSNIQIKADAKSDELDAYKMANLYENAYKLQWDYNSKK